MSIKEKIKTLIWFAQRPSFYPQILDLASKRVFPHSLENTRTEMEEWCSKRFIDTETAIHQLTQCTKYSPIENLFTEQFKKAEENLKKCPIQMGGPGELDLLYWLAEHINAMNVVETGVAYGWSSLAILLSLVNRSGSKLISTDMPYIKLNNEPYVGCVVPPDLRHHWTIIKLPDKQALPKALKILNHKIDMCHYDSDKSYVGRMWAYPILWNSLNKGGYFISDDIGDNVAFRDFSKALDITPIVVKKNNKYIGILVKK